MIDRSRLGKVAGALGEWHREFFVGRWRSGLQREARRQQDALAALLYLEAMGVPSPDPFLAAELYPEFAETFHRWHLRHGIDRFPDPGVCC